MPSPHGAGAGDWSARLDVGLLVLLLATLFLLPFEQPAPLLALGGIVVTNLEALLFLALAVWLCRVALRPDTLRPPFFAWPAAAIVLSACLSALFAVSFQISALKVAARWSLGVVFAVALADTLRRTRRDRFAFAAIVLGATTAPGLGLLEMGGSSWAAGFLALFRDAPAQLGPTARLSAAFGSANAAAMLLETALCLAVGLALDAARRRRRRDEAAWAACLVALAAALALTYSRGGIVAGAVGLMVALVLAIPHRKQLNGRRLGWTVLAMAAVVVAVLALNPVLRARLAVWDGRPLDAAVVSAPPTLSAEAGSALPVSVNVTNSGRLTWRANGPDSVALGYHWLTEDGQGVAEWDNARLPLPADVPPGGAVTLAAALVAPPAGRYALAWDVVHAPNEWLGSREAMPGWSAVVTTGAGGTPFPPSSRGRAPALPPDRGQLWRAALQMAREHPILGVGPSNFRRLYGTYLGLATWDDRILANNLYLELLADVGVVGLLAWGWLFASAAAHLWRALPSPRLPAPLARGVEGRTDANLGQSPPISGPLSPWERDGVRVLKSSERIKTLTQPLPKGEGADLSALELRVGEESWPFAIALLAAFAAWLVHGLTDVAFETTGIYLLLWALVGLAASLNAAPDVQR